MKKAILFVISICVSVMLNAQLAKTVNITTPGTLLNAFTANELSTVTDLKVIGKINDDDYITMRDKCTALQKLDLFESNYTEEGRMPYKAFYGCTGLISIIFPNQIKYIPHSAFYGCSGLTEINIPNSVTDIGNSSFGGCFRLVSVIIPSSVKSIGSAAFSSCTGLTSIIIPSSVTTIGDIAFYHCTNLTNATTPFGNNIYSDNTRKNIFEGCNKLTTIIIPDGVVSIKNQAFDTNFPNITSLSIPSSVTSVGEYAFYNCSNLTGSLIIPSASIGQYAFSRCKKLSSVSILSTATSIGYYAFSECSSLVSVSIPSSVKYIAGYAFENCTSLTTATTPFGNDNNISIFKGCTNLTSIIIPDGLKKIPPFAFSMNYNKITSVIIPSSVDTIDRRAFYSCSGLTSLNIPASVKIIGENAFAGCSSISGNLEIPNSVTSIGSWAFSGCSSLVSVTIPPTVSTLFSTFSGCSNLTSVKLPSTITSMFFTFENCSSLISATTPFGNDISNRSIFVGCNKLTEIIIPDGVTTIKADAFSNNFSTVTSISIPCSVNSIRNYAFSGCSNLTSLILPPSVMSIGSFAFQNCNNLSAIYSNLNTPIDLSSSSNVFENVNKTTCKLYVPFESYSKYAIANQWKDFININEMVEFKLSTNNEIVHANGGGVSVNLKTSLSWTVKSNQPWLTVNSTNGIGNKTLVFTIEANSNIESRSAVVTVSAPISPIQTLLFTQKGSNQAPVANAGLDQTTNEGTTVSLDGSASFDPDNDALTYQWTTPAGITLSSTIVAKPTFTAPEITQDTQFTFSLIVNDGMADSPVDQVVITVKNVNKVPVADAGVDQSVNEGATVSLDGSLSSDPDGTTITYKWTAPEGITLSSITTAKPTFTAPEVKTNTNYTFALVVNDGTINSPADQVVIIVLNVNKAPVANAGADQSVNEGTTVSLDGTLSNDPDNDQLTYTWTSHAKVILSDTKSPKPTFIAPEIINDSTIIFTLIVNDGFVNSLPDSVKIKVLNVINVGISTQTSTFLKVYPNPVGNELIIEYKGNTRKTDFEILNSISQVVYKGNIVEKTVVQTKSFSPGIYLIKLITGDLVEFKKILKN